MTELCLPPPAEFGSAPAGADPLPGPEWLAAADGAAAVGDVHRNASHKRTCGSWRDLSGSHEPSLILLWPRVLQTAPHAATATPSKDTSSKLIRWAVSEGVDRLHHRDLPIRRGDRPLPVSPGTLDPTTAVQTFAGARSTPTPINTQPQSRRPPRHHAPAVTATSARPRARLQNLYSLSAASTSADILRTGCNVSRQLDYST